MAELTQMTPADYFRGFEFLSNEDFVDAAVIFDTEERNPVLEEALGKAPKEATNWDFATICGDIRRGNYPHGDYVTINFYKV